MSTAVMRWWTAALGITALLCVSSSSPAFAGPAAREETGPPGGVIKVGIKPLDPFVARDGGGYRGFSIDLWNEIARRNGWQTDYVWYDTLPELLNGVRTSAVGAGISGITITKDREEVVDFSYPMFSAGLQVMTSSRAGSRGWSDELADLLTAGIGPYVLVLIAALITAGHVVWFATRRRTGRGYVRGVAMGVYQAAGLGLVGDYGVANPERPLARVVAVVWTIMGISFVSLFTAALASQLTLNSIQNKITGVNDLAGVRVLTVAGTSSEDYLRAHSISYSSVPRIEDAYARLDAGSADAIVYDAPVLQNRVNVTHSSAEVLVGPVFARENYGIALPNSSPLRKTIDTTLLDIIEDGTYNDLYSRYFTDVGSR